MPRTLIAHVSLWAANGDMVTLAPGDELPEWAEGRVGEHCFELDAEPAEVEDAVNTADADEVDVKAPAKSKEAAPDFTAPAPRRGRPRK